MRRSRAKEAPLGSSASLQTLACPDPRHCRRRGYPATASSQFEYTWYQKR